MRTRQLLPIASALVLAGLFVALAGARRLNFDESLALRAGALEVSGAAGEPAFLMPATLGLGVLASLLADPGAVFLVARISVVAATLALLLLAFSRFGLTRGDVALALCLSLVQGSFVTHALEFRYDAAILGALLLLAAALGDAARPWPAAAGVAVAVLGLHQLKGVFFALAGAILASVLLRSSRQLLARFAAGAGSVLALWIAGLVAWRHLDRWFETLAGFAGLAVGVRRVPLHTALGGAMLRDLAWWLLVLTAVIASALARRRAALARGETVALALAAATLALPIAHPHPWAYMLALPAPFLAAVAVHRWRAAGHGSRRAALLVALLAGVGLGLQVAATGRSPLAPWTVAWSSARTSQVETLRLLRRSAAPNERVLDPSGLAYFLPPCTDQWYVDTLFAERVRQREWMARLAVGVPADCTWALNTYRLGALPEASRAELAREFALLPSALALRRGDPRLELLASAAMGADGELRSFW